MGLRPVHGSGSRTARGRGRLLGARTSLALALAAALALTLAGIAAARMSSQKLSPTLCETTGGGRFVKIPGFPGERIDRRLLTDIRWIEKRYAIFITDGYSMDDVHASNGEHPIGLALDIVPNRAEGGTWSDIDRLAKWAEPRQNRPRAPFRWVGYNGDSGHGRGNHLHLSWSHSVTRAGHPARLVDTIRCPHLGSVTQPTQPTEPTEPTGPVTGGSPQGAPPSTDTNRHRGRNRDRNRNRNGGRQRGHGTGGVGGKVALAPVVSETGGVGLD